MPVGRISPTGSTSSRVVELRLVPQPRQSPLPHLDALPIAALEVIERLRRGVLRRVIAAGPGHPLSAVIGAGPRWLLVWIWWPGRAAAAASGGRGGYLSLLVAVGAHGGVGAGSFSGE